MLLADPGNAQQSLPSCSAFLRPDGSTGDAGTLAQCIFVANEAEARELPFAPVMTCSKKGGALFGNYTGLHLEINRLDLSDVIEALSNGT